MPLARAKHLQKKRLNDNTVCLASRWSISNDRWLNETAALVPFCMQDQNDPCWYLLCYNVDGTIKIFKLGYDHGVFGAWPQPVLRETRLPGGLNYGMMPFMATPYLLYQNANGNDQYASLVTVMEHSNGTYTAIHEQISGLPVSDDVQLVPLCKPPSPDLYVAAYDDSKLSLHKINLNHKRAHKIGYDIDLGSGWGAFAPLGDGSSFVYLNVDTGAMGAGKIEEDQLSVHQLDGTPLAGYDSLAALIGNGGPTFVAYSVALNITPQIFTVRWNPLRINPKPSEDWPPNISSIATFEVAEDQEQSFYLIAQEASSTVALTSTGPSLMITSGIKPGYPEDDQPPPGR